MSSVENIISPLTLGTAQFGSTYGIANRQGQPTYRDILAILACAHENGIYCLDTAATYGKSEELIGRALAELKIADEMFVVTKIRHITPDATVIEAHRQIRRSVEESLQNLRLESLPLCLFHREQDFCYWEALENLRQEGLIREIGISVMTPFATAPMVESGTVRAIQLPANLLDQRFRRSGITDRAGQQGIILFCRSIYLQGLLLMPESEVPSGLASIVPIRRRLEILARESGLSLTEMAARYILSLPEIASIVMGVESADQLRQNLALFNHGPLETPLVEAIEAIVPPLSEDILLPTRWPKENSS